VIEHRAWRVSRVVHNAPLTKQKAARRRPLFRGPGLSRRSESALASEMRLGGLGAPECDCACDRSRPGPYGVTVVAALNDPLTVFLADNFPYVMAPHHDSADFRTARV
jgi:hypothetical protein